MAIVTVNRDPYARTETERQTLTDRRPCAWCGQPARFQYRTASDGGRVGGWSRTFCTIECCRAFSS
jgi:hypothetical protein